ncbi:hypothetical protein [Streptomyces sp. NPDC088789]|uniref:hypothetical protein n=1 Tax=Streptomyces sp. NPDC088789 TaxID=3365899 RepID=UPI0037FCECE8
MAQPDPAALGRAAYTAYAQAADGTTHDGRPLPAWEDLSDTTRAAWTAAARESVRAAFRLSPVTVHEPRPLPPYAGATVMVAVDPATNNGSPTAAALVTRVWTGTSIDVRVLLDSEGALPWRTSLTYADTLDGLDANARFYRWSWPAAPRV